jgi:hypothetical protein
MSENHTNDVEQISRTLAFNDCNHTRETTAFALRLRQLKKNRQSEREKKKEKKNKNKIK